MSTSAAPASRRWPTHAALLVVQVAFAAGAVEGKLAMRPWSEGGGGVDPFALAMARMAGATLFFQVLSRARGRRALPWREHVRLVGLSILGIVANQTLYLVGLRITTAFAAALLGATISVFTAALAIAFRLERPSWRTGAGLALALVGMVTLTGVGALDLGAIVIAINCLSYSFYVVLSKPVLARIGALELVTWAFTWGALLLAPVGAPRLVHGAAVWDARAWALVLFIVAMPTVVAYFFNAWALARSTPTMVTIYIYLQPLLAALLQWVQLGDRVGVRALVAAAFILAGVSVVVLRRSVVATR